MTGREPTSLRPASEEVGLRLALYRRVARALGNFFERFTFRHCADCLAVTRSYHAGDPRADVELLAGVFPGCCHAGVGDALWVPRSGEEGRFSPELGEAVARAREALGAMRDAPLEYSVRERQTGCVAKGVACIHLDPGGCRLGDLKGPLCLAYLCEPVREALGTLVGPELIGSDTDDFCGALEALRGAVAGELVNAKTAVAALEQRLGTLAERLEATRG